MTDLAVVFPRAGVTGGVERVALQVLRHQAARRDARFVGERLDDAPALQDRLVRVATPPVPPALRPVAFRRAAARALAGLAPTTTLSFGANCPPGDVYWVQSVHAAWLRDGGELLVRGRRVPPVLRRALLRHQVLLRLEREYFAHRPRAVLCTSAREVDDLAELYGVPRALMHVAPNGFDGAVFNPGVRERRRADVRRRMDVAPDDVVVLMVANEWHRKGLATLLEAVAETGDRRLRIDLVGARSPAAFEPLAERLGLRDRLHWHGPSADVAGYYAAADVFALPTTYEPFGIVIVEAIASGVAAVVPRLAGAAGELTDGHGALLLDDPRDVSALAAALRRLADPEGRAGVAAPEAVAGYEWTRVLDRVDALLFPGG